MTISTRLSNKRAFRAKLASSSALGDEPLRYVSSTCTPYYKVQSLNDASKHDANLIAYVFLYSSS